MKHQPTVLALMPNLVLTLVHLLCLVSHPPLIPFHLVPCLLCSTSFPDHLTLQFSLIPRPPHPPDHSFPDHLTLHISLIPRLSHPPDQSHSQTTSLQFSLIPRPPHLQFSLIPRPPHSSSVSFPGYLTLSHCTFSSVSSQSTLHS